MSTTLGATHSPIEIRHRETTARTERVGVLGALQQLALPAGAGAVGEQPGDPAGDVVEVTGVVEGLADVREQVAEDVGRRPATCRSGGCTSSAVSP